MTRRMSSKSRDTTDISRALRRAARNALELGIKTGTPVYVMRNNQIVDLTKDKPTNKKSRRRSVKLSSK
jgi:hypothetical protein